jgi:hypothetical protein
MGHYISGFIAQSEQLMAAAETLPHAQVCSLRLGFAFLPLTDAIASPDDPMSKYKQLIQLTQPMADWADAQSWRFPIAYIETEYFGGSGGQGAVLWRDGKIMFGPVRTNDAVVLLDGAINIAVRQIGVERGQAIDEFAALGLDRYRDNGDWVAAVGAPAA